VQEQIVREASVPSTILRPAIVYGAGAKNYLTEIIKRAPFLPALDRCRPPLQMVHVDDVARAIAHVAIAGVRGTFNVAPDDWLSYAAVARIARKPVVSVPLALTRGVDWLLPMLPPHWRAPRAMLPYLMYPFVLSNAALVAAQWHPQTTATEAARAVLG
jgi:UDP-glucose 4-epimerase